MAANKTPAVVAPSPNHAAETKPKPAQLLSGLVSILGSADNARGILDAVSLLSQPKITEILSALSVKPAPEIPVAAHTDLPPSTPPSSRYVV